MATSRLYVVTGGGIAIVGLATFLEGGTARSGLAVLAGLALMIAGVAVIPWLVWRNRRAR